MAVKLLVTAFCNAALAILLYIAEKNTRFKKVPYPAKQVICGVLFGLIAMYSSTPMGGIFRYIADDPFYKYERRSNGIQLCQKLYGADGVRKRHCCWCCVAVASLFTSALQIRMSKTETESVIKINLNDVYQNILATI